jgi:hypothetical protein
VVREVENMLEMDANMKAQCALYEFERTHGIRPNRIVMGYHLLDEVVDTFYDKNFTMKTLEEVAREQKLGVRCEYMGIPVEVDYNNTELLEVGYMVKWMENKH